MYLNLRAKILGHDTGASFPVEMDYFSLPLKDKAEIHWPEHFVQHQSKCQ